MRQSGTSPERDRCSSPGSSLRSARSPVAPNSTMTCGVSGDISAGRMSCGLLSRAVIGMCPFPG